MVLINKRTFLINLAGFIWGLSGFTVEILSEGAFQQQLAFRLILIVISSSIIYFTLPFYIKKNNILTIILLLVYLLFFTITTVINNASVSNIIREIVLLYSSITIIIIISSKENILTDFIQGLYYALILLGLFYFIHIEFTKLFSLFYRFETNLNPNGIGMIAVMLFSISMNRYYLNSKNREKIFHLLAILVSVIIVIATRSRTSLAMMLIAFILLNILFKKKHILAISLIIGSLVVIYNLETFENLIRLSNPAGYSGNKNFGNLTGRTNLWKQGLEIISNNFFFGVGPDRAVVKIDYHWGSFHNAYIQLLVTVGVLGFIPLFVLVFLAIKRTIFFKDDFLLTIIFIIGFLGSFLENRLLNFGSPGNLLFLISLLYLGRIRKKDSSNSKAVIF